MSNGVMASVSGFAPKRHVEERVPRGLGDQVPRGLTIDTDEKNAGGASKDGEAELTRVVVRAKRKRPSVLAN